MKRTTLRTSAIALGVAAALPATAQEWNLGWGGYMNQHIVFGSNEKKTTVSLDDLSYTVTSNRGTTDNANDDLSFNIKFLEGTYDGLTALNAATEGAGITNHYTDGTALISALNGNTKLEKVYVEAGELGTLQSALNAAITLNGAQDVENLIVYVTAPSGTTAKIEEVNGAIKSSGTGQWPDAEIHFKPSITLENGLTFGAHVEFEALHHDRGGATRDESYVTISSDSLGMFIIGSENSAGYRMMVAAPSVGLGINSGSHPDFLPGYGYSWRAASGSSYTESWRQQ